jgi:hypothetical protein
MPESGERRCDRSRVVKELDLIESNHGSAAERASTGKDPKGDVTQRYMIQNWCLTSSQAVGSGQPITHGFTFEYFDLTGSVNN